MTFFGDYFLDNNTIHCVGECIREDFFILPIHVKTDFNETKCGLSVNGMEWFLSGTLQPQPGLTFCENCIK